MPMLRLWGGTAETGWPAMKISPDAGRTKPAIMRSSVVLPEPLGPRMVRKRPRPSSNEAASTARTWSKTQETPSTRTMLPARVRRYRFRLQFPAPFVPCFPGGGNSSEEPPACQGAARPAQSVPL